jgi:RHS repeat-associated protein
LLLLVFAQAAEILAQNGPPSKDRYIIVLKSPKNGVPELSDVAITAGGGKVEYKVPGQIQVTLPAPAVEAMRKQERVKYIQKVILGPLPNASAPVTLRMTPSTSSLRATTESTPPTWKSGTYRYDMSGNIYAIGIAEDTGLATQHRYAYDELSRLKRADTITTSTHTETFTYDAYGNLTEHVDGSAVTSTPVEDPNTNRLAWSAAHPYIYDAAGNLTADYNAAYFYDPFSMLLEKDYGSKQEFYIYTASDERIGVKYGTASNGPTIWSIRDFSGNVLRQYESHDQTPQMAWLWKEDYVYRGGQLLAAERVPEEGGRRHFHLDHLGSPRLVTGQDSKEMSEHDFEPFGLEANPQWQETNGGFDREDPKRFTGHERDYAAPPGAPASTAYLDYMHARYYTPIAGRFLSPDPLDGLQRFPQSWNRYAYARNNPLRYIDPTGQYVFAACAGSAGQCQADQTAFEQARQHDLGSHDQAVHDAAAAYGDPGQVNGVSVAFGNLTNSAGTTAPALQGNADGTMGLAATVTIQTGLSGTALNAAVGHEGQHVLDAQGFVASFTKNAASWDLSRNLTKFQTETNGYRITDSIYRSAHQSFSMRCQGCTLGTGARTPADRDLAITRILADPSGVYKVTSQNQGNRQFPEWTTPPPQP